MRSAVIRQSSATPALDQFTDPQPGQGLSVGTLVAAALNPLDVAITNDQFPFRRLQPPASPAGKRSWQLDDEALGESGLDVLISNAGILTPGPLEVLPVAAVGHEFEVNVFAGLAVINVFLPALRRARGRIVQIGAVTGRLPLPFNGPSSASKVALEAFADIYRTELRAWAPSSSRMVDAAWRPVWRVRRRPMVTYSRPLLRPR
jgi:NAD(P)-dependent dehydrogenase (short-subunit alcohol dehydrogenase family)